MNQGSDNETPLFFSKRSNRNKSKTLKYFSGTDLEVNQCVYLFQSFQEAPALLTGLPEGGGGGGGGRALQRDGDASSVEMGK